jgi:hypothetical protein
MLDIKNIKNSGEFFTCDILHPKLGWIPFTADPNDPENLGKVVYAEIIRQGFVPSPPVQEVQEAVDERLLMECSRFQAKAALLHVGKLSVIETIVSQAGPQAKLAWAEASTFKRTSPLLNQLAKHPLVNMSDEDLDNLFRIAIQVAV